MAIVCDALRPIPADRDDLRWQVFNGMLPLLRLSAGEAAYEFNRVQAALRYELDVRRDLASLSRFRLHRHALCCRVQASLTSRSRLC